MIFDNRLYIIKHQRRSPLQPTFPDKDRKNETDNNIL